MTPRLGPLRGLRSGQAVASKSAFPGSDAAAPDRRVPRVLLGALVLLFAFAYALLGIVRHRHFGSSAYDLGIFDQAVWHLSRFEPPASTISGFSNILGDHFYPIVAFFAPLYWIAPRPETLIVAQAMLLAASMVPVCAFLARRLPVRIAILLTVAYALSWGIQQTAVFDVHEMAFAPLLVALVILAMDEGRWRLFWTAAVGLMLVKEDLIPFLSGVGLYLIARGERRRGGVLLAVSLAAFAAVTQLIVPSFADTGAYSYTGAFAAVMNKPWTIPVVLVTPIIKVRTTLLWFAPFLFLSLASPLGALIVPVALERLLSASPLHWGTIFHYSAPIAPIVAMSAGDGLARLLRRRRANGALGGGTRGGTDRDGGEAPRLLTGLAVTCIALAAILPGRLPLVRLFTPAYYRPIPAADAAAAALAAVPPNASVVAQAAIAPHLSERPNIFMLQPDAPDADIVIASTEVGAWPMTDAAAVRTLVDERIRLGYRVIFNRDGWYVLSRANTVLSPKE